MSLFRSSVNLGSTSMWASTTDAAWDQFRRLADQVEAMKMAQAPTFLSPPIFTDAAAKPQPSSPPALPPSALPSVDEELDELLSSEYGRLAKKLGYAPPVDRDHALKKFLKSLGIEVYDFELVMSFLHAIAPKSAFAMNVSQAIVWRPLGTKDEKKSPRFRTVTPYARKVPYHILALVDRLLEKDVDLCFGVSDYADVKPDPFLLVIDKSGAQAVIAHWDEPDWGDWKNAAKEKAGEGVNAPPIPPQGA